MPEKNYSIEIQGEEVSSQVKSQIESGLRVCFREIQNLTGLAKCVALISHSRRSYCDHGEALSLLTQAYAEIETLKNLENTHSLSYIFFDLAVAFGSRNLHDKALISINRAIGIQSEKSEYYAIKSKILDNLERYEEAIASINKAIEIDPVNPEHYLIKSTLLDFSKCYKDALSSDEQAIKINSKNYYFYSNKGLTLSLIGDDYRAAINSCDRAIQLGGNKK
jgi:tetratricopeptide (TPR) repeat protein